MTYRALGAIIVSFAVSSFGFVMWYFKVQQYQDQTTVDAAREQAARAEKAERELRRDKRVEKRRHR
jgi:hypothetical protein